MTQTAAGGDTELTWKSFAGEGEVMDIFPDTRQAPHLKGMVRRWEMSLLFQRERFQERQRLGRALAKLVERRSNQSLLDVAKCKRAGISTALVSFPLAMIKISDQSKLRENRFILALGLTQSVLAGKSGDQSLNNSQETAISTGSPHFFHFTQAGPPAQGGSYPQLR